MNALKITLDPVDFSSLINSDHRTVRDLINRQVIPQNPDGSITLDDGIRGYVQYLRARRTSKSPELEAADLEFRQAKAEAERIKLDLLKRDLVRADEVAQTFSAGLVLLKNALQAAILRTTEDRTLVFKLEEELNNSIEKIQCEIQELFLPTASAPSEQNQESASQNSPSPVTD
jgi:hypothetical protein